MAVVNTQELQTPGCCCVAMPVGGSSPMCDACTGVPTLISQHLPKAPKSQALSCRQGKGQKSLGFHALELS